jgi:glucose/arabinose dehydrogenase
LRARIEAEISVERGVTIDFTEGDEITRRPVDWCGGAGLLAVREWSATGVKKGVGKIRRLQAIGLLVAAAVAAAVWLAPKLRRFDMQGMRPVTVASGLDHPWAIAFLPGDRLLVTERPGRMRVISADGTIGAPLAGLPAVWANDEGGLMDVVLDPAFAANQSIYWSYSEPNAAGDAASTAIATGRFADDRLDDVRVIFRQSEKSGDGTHFGSRLAFASDGLLYVGLGDRGRRADAQRLDSAHGKILRMRHDGTAPPDNPFVDTPGAVPQIWTLGHRNVQGLAFAADGTLWATEHGPRGGDELNLIVKGRNYGWPTITYGTEYETSAKIGEGFERVGMEQPVIWWGPTSNAPSGLAILTSERYPGWRGHLFAGTLQGGRAVLRLALDGTTVVEQQLLATGMRERIREVREGPDGWLYVTTKNPEGRVIRLERRAD